MAGNEKNTIDALVDACGMPHYTTNQAVNRLVDGMLNFFIIKAREKGDDEMVELIEKAHLKRYNAKIIADHRGAREKSYLFRGPGGHGKTTGSEVAVKIVADMLGMKVLTTAQIVRELHKNPDWVPGDKDIPLHTMQMSGKMTDTEFGGVPYIDEWVDAGGKKHPRTMMVPDMVLVALSKARLSVLLLDDFLNSTETVQNVALSIVERQCFNTLDLGACYGIVTANLGSLDGANISEASGPLLGRLRQVLLTDDPDDWCARINSQFNDHLGDCHVTAFIRAQGVADDLFTILPDDERIEGEVRSATPNPRTYHDLVGVMRKYFNLTSQNPHEPISLATIKDLASESIGKYAGTHYATFVHRVMSEVEPIVRKIFETGEFDEEAFNKVYGNGASASSREREHQFASSFAINGAAHYLQNTKSTDGNPDMRALEKATALFAKGTIPLSAAGQQLALNAFAERLANMTDLSVEGKSPLHGTLRKLRDDVKDQVSRTILETWSAAKILDAELRDIVISNLSGLAKISNKRQRTRSTPAAAGA